MACTDPEIGRLLGSYELGLLSAEEKGRFEAHLLACDHCFDEAYRSSPVAGLIRERRLAPEAPMADPRPDRRFALVWALRVAAVIVVIIAGFLAFRTMRPPEEGELLRGPGAGAIVLYAPVGAVPVPAELDWKVVPGAVGYEVTVFDETGGVVWRRTVKGPPARIPVEAQAVFEPGGVHVWQVVATSAEGDRWTSEPTRFEIRD